MNKRVARYRLHALKRHPSRAVRLGVLASSLSASVRLAEAQDWMGGVATSAGRAARDSRVQAEARKAAEHASRSAKRVQRLGAERSLHDKRVSRDLRRSASHASRAASFAVNGPPKHRIRTTALVIAGAGTAAGVMYSRRPSHATTAAPSRGDGDAPASDTTPDGTATP